MKLARVSILCIAAAACCSNATAQLANGGFEDPISYDTFAPGNWLAFFGPAGVQNVAVTNAAPRSGAQNLVTSLSGAPNTFNGVVQPIDGIVAGQSYTLNLWARAAGAVQNGAEFRIEWVNAVGGFVGGQFDLNVPIQGQLTDTYQPFSLTAVAPAEAVRANVVFAIQTFTNDGMGFDTAVYWDDVSFVPAPGAAGLLALGGLLAMRRRR